MDHRVKRRFLALTPPYGLPFSLLLSWSAICDCDAMSIIDEKLAKKFLDDPDDVDLSEATNITDGAAESLSKHQGKINSKDPKEWVESLRQ